MRDKKTIAILIRVTNIRVSNIENRINDIIIRMKYHLPNIRIKNQRNSNYYIKYSLFFYTGVMAIIVLLLISALLIYLRWRNIGAYRLIPGFICSRGTNNSETIEISNVSNAESEL